jgi:hypothetical protein
MAAMAACVIQVHPTWTPAALRTRLFETASDYIAYGTYDPLYVRGYGIPDAALAAFNEAGAPDIPLMIGDALLEQNAPNPFRPATVIGYTLPQSGPVRLGIFDVTGRLVRKLVDQGQTAGRHQVLWDGRDMAGQTAASGLYYYRLVTGNIKQTRRMVRLR